MAYVAEPDSIGPRLVRGAFYSVSELFHAVPEHFQVLVKLPHIFFELFQTLLENTQLLAQLVNLVPEFIYFLIGGIDAILYVRWSFSAALLVSVTTRMWIAISMMR